MSSAYEVGPGRFTVPHNRWDLLPAPTAEPRVTVVVPYFEQQAGLERLLAGIEAQTGPAQLCELIVADDGSSTPPHIPTWFSACPTIVVRQPDHGMRPGTARNLGAREASGDVLVFLDGDMVPSPTYVAAMAGLPAVAPEALAVGTRVHHDLSGWTARAVRRWLVEGDTPPPRLEDPAWLADGYHRSRDLLDLDDRSYQLVISAVMAMSAELFGELGGFDETIDTYGGEDWELAHRAYLAGGILAHLPAVAYHDGPDWRARVGPTGTKNAERMHLARTVPGRDDAVIGRFAQVVVTFDARGVEDDYALTTISSLLRAGRTAVAIAVLGASARVSELVAPDPRVRPGPPDPAGATRALVRVRVMSPLTVDDATFAALIDEVAPGRSAHVVLDDAGGPLLEVRSTRACSRADRWSAATGEEADVWLERLFGATRRIPAEQLGVRRLTARPDLHDEFPR